MQFQNTTNTQSSRSFVNSNFKITKREFDVLDSISKGLNTKNIAKLLFISESTVISHKKNLFRKLNTNSLVSLVVKSIKIGLITI